MKAFSQTALILGLIIALSGSANAQQSDGFPKNELQASYGIGTLTEIEVGLGETMASAFADIFSFSPDSVQQVFTSAKGSINLQYARRLSKVIKLGVTASFNPVKSRVEFKQGYYSHDSWYFISLMPRIDFLYLNRGIFSMYSGLAVGATYYIDKNTTSDQGSSTLQGWLFAFQINALGFRVGKDIGGFAEFGFGDQGLINIGISGRF